MNRLFNPIGEQVSIRDENDTIENTADRDNITPNEESKMDSNHLHSSFETTKRVPGCSRIVTMIDEQGNVQTDFINAEGTIRRSETELWNDQPDHKTNSSDNSRGKYQRTIAKDENSSGHNNEHMFSHNNQNIN